MTAGFLGLTFRVLQLIFAYKKTQKSKFRIWKKQVQQSKRNHRSRCTAKFFQTKIARRVYWKINCSKNSKIQIPDMERTGSAMTKPQESMHRKIFPNKNRKTRLLENQLQLKLKNPNSGYGKNRFSNDKTTKTTKSRCTAKFFQTKIARRVYWKINCSKNSKIQTPDMEKTGSAMTKPQESMHRKIFPNKNRKTRVLENQLQQKLKNPNSGYGKNRFSNDKNHKSRCTAKFFQTKIARRVYWKINCSKNSKIQIPDMERTGSAMTKPQESMHRKIFPNKNRKTRLLENQLQLKLKNPNSGYGKNRFSNDKTTKTTKSRCTAKFFQTKIARRVYWKINSSKNSKIQTPDMAKISLPRGCNGKTPKKPTKKNAQHFPLHDRHKRST